MSEAVLPLNSDSRAAVARVGALLGLPHMEPGWVWLAGAGPGDPGLAPLLTLAAIAEADAIFVDALVNPDPLKLARPGAEIVESGKRAGRPSPKQDQITRALISAARQKKRVLRLKGGDPFVFGRGGEEALALARAQIPFRVVPAATAGIGGLAYAGIPVTHRDLNHAVTFITGHGTDGKLPNLDWTSIANGSPTIVLYMARAHAAEIAARLIAAGRGAYEPAAIVSNASLPNQQTLITTLGGLGAAAAQSSSPAIIVIGENVKLAAELDWLALRTLTAA